VHYHTLVISQPKVFSEDFRYVCALLARSFPGSVQHTPVVSEYLEVRSGPSVYNAFILFHEVVIFLGDHSLPFFSILNVLVLCFNSNVKELHVKTHSGGSKPFLLAICFRSFMVLAQFFAIA
jgi:hypothetical protein